ncbi:hypothetical protein [Ezakiella peruensis]|uniref:hypothetical protein n=1 Tax=Ezakiella peruensis TaxID=1464038 RepID=UPI000C1B405F|nr:hypothetical protein [Ezakiella peruensis]
MNRKFKAAAWAVLLILFVLSGVIVHAQDETMSTNTPESILEETSKEAIIDEGDKSVEVLFDASKDLVNEAVQAGAANGENEEPGTEEPGTEEPGTEEPGTEEPGTEEPGTPDEPGTEEPGTEEPGTEEPGTEEPGTEEPGTEEPGTEEPGTEEPEADADKPKETSEPAKPQVDPNTDELNELQKQIAAAKEAEDEEEVAELQKKYNDKLLKSIEESGADKLDKDVINGITDPEKIKQYKDIQELYDKIQADKNDGKLNQADIERLNTLLGEFKPPRKLTDEEKKAQEDLNKDFEIPGIKGEDTKDKVFEKYQDAKEALEKALNPNENPVSKEELERLKKAYKDAKDALDAAIEKGDIDPKYTDGTPEVRVYPLDGSTAGPELKDKDETYYIPDNTSAKLLIEVRKDDGGDFTFTIKPNKTDKNIPDAVLEDLVRTKDGKAIKLTKDEDGNYSFTTSNQFEIAQIQMNLPAFRAAFHEGFKITMQAGSEKAVTKKFLITKKGYDDADIGTIGKENPKDPQEIDGGDTKDGIVDEDTKKVYDIFAMIKETDGYIDDVIVNSGNGESLPLSSVDITIKLPEYNGKFADYLYKSGLEYQDNKDGTYTLKLKMKNFGGNLKEKDGKLYLDDKEITPAKLRDKILEEAGKKVYVDEKGEKHEITTEEYYEVTDDEGNTFKVQDGKLYKKNSEGKDELVGEFKNGKFKDKNTTYVFNNGKLISYTDEKDLFEGNVSNKNGEADLDVTPTYDGGQVIIKTGDNKQAYGGTIIENGIFDKDGKYTGKTSSAEGYQGLKDVYVDESGKKVDNPTDAEKENLTKVDKGVFNADGYLISGLTHKENYTLIDKFGKIMDGITVTKGDDGNYTFAKEGKESKTSGSDGITVETGTKFVGNDNYIVDPKGYDDPIVGKYYYDGKKFVPVKDNDKGIKGDKYFKDYKSSAMDHKKVDTYKKDANTTVELHNVEEYHGSTNPDDYVTVNNKTYVKKQAGSLVYYVGVDEGNQAEVLSVDQISKIVQILKDENGKEYEKLTDETDIAEAVKNAKFQIKFPGFLAGKDVVYNIHADIAATYMAPNPNKEESDPNKKFVETSIFKDQKSDYKKPIDKYFTLKIKEGQPASFFKNPPKELLAKPDYNFFNVFYRDETDRDRDDYIKHLLGIEADDEKRVDPKNKADMDILKKIQSELGRLYNGAKFAIKDNKLVILDKNGDVTTLDRSLLWEVGFNNPDGALFPENKDSEIIIEDHNMDNRLIYDEIIVNDTQDKWNTLKEEFEDKEENKGKKFGNDQYFFLDQIKDIRFGVSPTYIDGRFVPLGENFKITGQEIIDKLGDKDSATITTKNGIEFKITRDKANGQVRIKVMNAFYKKVDNDPTHKFESPVQKDYQGKINGVLEKVKKLDKNSSDDFINGIVESLHAKETDCYKTITKMLKDEFVKIKTDAKKLQAFKTKLIAEVEKLKLGYFDEKKGDYKYDDMRFNAIRIGLTSGLRIGGPTDPVKTKKIGITSVIIPEVDIPYTDEFGKPLTNKDKYVQEEIGNIIKDHKFNDKEDNNFKFFDEQGNPIWNKDEDSFRKVMEEAYRRVNKMDENTFKTLVTVNDKEKYGQGKYTVIPGKELSFDDLANGDKALKDSKGQPLNPYYVGDKKDGKATTIEEKIKDPKSELKDTDAYKELINRPIDIAGYYMSKLGYNGAMYANFANYKLIGGKDQAPGIFGKDDDWHKKICYPGLGSCIEDAGSDSETDKTEGGNKYGSEGETGSEFELTYEPTPKTQDEEHPEVDKKSETDKVDVTEEPEKKVDFTIDVTVDKLKKDDKKLSEAVKEDSEDINDANYNDNGYYIYRDGLIIDILPDIFEFTKDTEISIEVDKDAMRANGANADLDFVTFKNGIKYFYTEDVKAYLAELKAKDKKKYNVLLKALGGDESKIKDGQRAILAWLPEFEGPHGAKNQFTMTLKNLLVNKEKYKESEEYKNQGQPYTNKAGFGDKGEFFFGTKTITVTDGHNANVNKYLQLLDKDGKVIPQGEAGEWFKGSATLKFGDKFNYKIKYYLDNKGLVDTGFVQKDKEWKLEDLFNGNKGLRPVLRDFVKVPDGFTVLYKVNGEYKEASQITEADLAKVEGIKINPPEAGFPYNEEKEFILPMMIPELDAKIEDGNVVYVGKDGEKKILGKADEFFNLGDLTKKDAKMYFENTAEGSNTVTVYLEKERFIKLFKEFFEADGKTEIKKDRPEVKFDIYQIVTDENGKIIDRIKLDKGLTLNEANDFVDQVNHLPLFKRIEEMDEEGNVSVKTLSYTYEVQEQAIEGYTGKVFKFDEKDALGFVLKAENYKKPEKPDKPEEPEEPEEDEPKEPEEPEEDEPKEPEEPEEDEPGKPDEPETPEEPEDEGGGRNTIPKTGVRTDLGSIFFSGILLLALFFFKRKFFKN